MSRSGTTNQDKGAGCLLLLLLVVLLAIGNNFGVHIALAWAVFFMALYVGWRMWREGTPFSFSTPKAKDLHAEFQAIGNMTGGQFEVFMAKIYRALGYSTTVLGGSGDQGVDLIVLTSDGKIAIQCKNYARPVGNKPVQEVYAGAHHHGCTDAWVVAPNGYTKGAQKLAESVGVKLYDAVSIREWIQAVDEIEKEEAESATDEPRRSSRPWWRRMFGG